VAIRFHIKNTGDIGSSPVGSPVFEMTIRQKRPSFSVTTRRPIVAHFIIRVH